MDRFRMNPYRRLMSWEHRGKEWVSESVYWHAIGDAE